MLLRVVVRHNSIQSDSGAQACESRAEYIINRANAVRTSRPAAARADDDVVAVVRRAII